MIHKLSIVVPIFNEEENINRLHAAITDVAKKLQWFNEYEIVAVDDGSSDESLQKLRDIVLEDHRLRIVSFSRNFGQETATVAGLDAATGDAIAILDADLQDPPELLLKFEEVLAEGYDIAYGQRVERLEETFLKKMTSRLFHRVFCFLSGIDYPRGVSGGCCMLSRSAVESIKQFKDKLPFTRGMIYWAGHRKKGIPFIRQGRVAGKTKYNYKKMFMYSLNGFLSFSTMPLYIMAYVSAFCFFVSTMSFFGIVLLHLFGIWVVSNLTILVLFFLFLFSIAMVCAGTIGVYLGKMFMELRPRPRYVVEQDEPRRINLKKESDGIQQKRSG
jgi:dolichol-phosphate mannosyltransferase